MGFGISLPSLSDIRNTVTNTVTSATDTVRDLGSSAIQHTADLGRAGIDLGRRAVDAARSIDVREAASAVRQKIGEGTEAARDGIKTGVEWAGQKTHETADFARDHVPGGDNIVSNGIRGAITVAEDSTRFQLGVVGGVTREVVGLAGTVGQLGTTLTEMQLSPEASAEYGQKILDGAKGAAEATGNYVNSVAHDPSRLGSDIGHVAEAGENWAGGQIDRYQQAFRDGKGFETVGMDVGTIATYVVPVGGGPVRGALTAAARGGTEAAVRGGAEAAVRGGVEIAARDGAEVVARDGAEALPRVAEGGSTIARDGRALSDPIARAAERAEIPEARFREIVETPRGERPAPSTYMSADQISRTLAKFEDGAIRITSRDGVASYGTLGPPGGFVMPAREFEGLVDLAKGDLRVVEQKLGLDAGALSSDDTLIAYIERGDMTNLRVPSGNESGANAQWLPGGYTSGGLSEGVMDFPKGTEYRELTLSGDE